MKKRLVIHIGTHKTGSTSIQHFLHANRQQHLESYRLYYPRTDRDPEPRPTRHTFLTLAALDHAGHPVAQPRTPPPEALVREITEEIETAGADVALLSEESLSMPDPKIAEAYRGFAKHFEVKVLVFLRRQDLFVEALHNQFIRDRGEQRSLADFAAVPRTQARMDYRTVLQAWEAAFGRDAIVVIPFERPVREEGLLNTVFRVLGISPAVPLQDPLHNVSPGREAAELIRRLNGSRAPKRMSPIERVIEELGLTRGTTRILSNEQRRTLLAAHAEGNAEIARRYLGREDGALFREQPDHDADSEQAWQMSDAEVIDHLAKVCCRMSTIIHKLRARQRSAP